MQIPQDDLINFMQLLVSHFLIGIEHFTAVSMNWFSNKQKALGIRLAFKKLVVLKAVSWISNRGCESFWFVSS